ncbi:hypothetical protein BD408DRAFT_416944 [Parasitella parasitica]|nr:hypothetical protein BD408DRAFT_416944 [Parasitella parasitica]
MNSQCNARPTSFSSLRSSSCPDVDSFNFLAVAKVRGRKRKGSLDSSATTIEDVDASSGMT